MMTWLERLFPRVLPATRQRPEEMVYGIDDKPPLPVVVGMGVQHALLALIFALYAAIAGQSMGLDTAQTAAYVSATVLIMGCGTLLQALPTRFGAGMLLVTIPGAGRLSVQVAVTLNYGLAAMMGATIVAALMTVALARVIPRLRPIFPPEVIGVVLVMMGITLVTGGVSRSVGLSSGATGLSPAAIVAAVSTIACMVGIAIWGSAALRRVAMLAGALVGTAVTALTGNLPALELLAMPFVSVPVLGLGLPVPEFQIVPILIVAVTQFITMMDQFGSALTMDRMTDARWRRADMPMVGRAITGMGLTHVLFGLTGTLPGGSGSANIGLAHATGIAARRVGVAAGLTLMLAAFFPQLAALLVMTPAPVVGGILLYTAAYMITAGMDLIMSRMMNARRSLTVGLAIVMGCAVMLVPELGQAAPDWLKVIVQSGLTVGAITAVALNAVFRIGVRQTQRHALEPPREVQQAQDAMQHDGKLWGVRQDTILRAGHAVGEALEALREAGVEGPIVLTASFDEFHLVTTLAYTGAALRFGPVTTPDMQAMLDGDDDDMDAAMLQLSALLIVKLADRVRAVARGSGAELQLTFNH